MGNLVSVKSLSADFHKQKYDLLVAAAGYEERARYVSSLFSQQSGRKMAFAFDRQRCMSFDENVGWFSDHKFEIVESSDSAFGDVFRKALLEKLSDARLARILIDISSQSRYRLAEILAELNTLPTQAVLTCDFLYSLATYNEPPQQSSSNTHVGPVSDRFCGWWTEPDRPSCAVVGIGYEQDKALGAVEVLEPSEVWVFTPESQIPEYTNAVKSANSALLESLVKERIVRYNVHQPFDTITKLESLVYGLSRTRNPILLPFGPKIFTLASLVVGLVHRNVPVWRVSGGANEVPIQRIASGHICGITATFSSESAFEAPAPRELDSELQPA